MLPAVASIIFFNAGRLVCKVFSIVSISNHSFVIVEGRLAPSAFCLPTGLPSARDILITKLK